MILAFDPGNETGFAVVENKKVIDCGIIYYHQKPKLKHMDELLYIKAVKHLYEKYLPEITLIEQGFMGRYPSIVKALERKITLIKVGVKMCFPEALIKTTTPTEWKALLQIMQKSKKDDRTEKEKVMDKLKEILGDEFIVDIINPILLNKGQVIKEDEYEHIIDAITVAEAYSGKVKVKAKQEASYKVHICTDADLNEWGDLFDFKEEGKK